MLGNAARHSTYKNTIIFGNINSSYHIRHHITSDVAETDPCHIDVTSEQLWGHVARTFFAAAANEDRRRAAASP